MVNKIPYVNQRRRLKELETGFEQAHQIVQQQQNIIAYLVYTYGGADVAIHKDDLLALKDKKLVIDAEEDRVILTTEEQM